MPQVEVKGQWKKKEREEKKINVKESQKQSPWLLS